MQPFEYQRAADAGRAVNSVAGEVGARFLAGGTGLIDLMKLDVESPVRLVDISRLPLTQVEETPGGLRVGALVRNSDLAYHPAVRERFPALSEALLSGASPQLRNMATTGGNLMQRTRCPYFRDTRSACNKRSPGSGCAALEGYNRSHAVLGTSDRCIATHPSDMCVALTALDAVIHTQGPRGDRAIPITEFYIAYGDDPARETVLEHGELITGVELSDTPSARRSHYLKVRDRASYEFALASAAVALDVQDGKIRAARVALGGIATKPWRSYAAERALVGRQPGEEVYRSAAEAALAEAKPHKHNGFKVELARRTVAQALVALEERP